LISYLRRTMFFTCLLSTKTANGIFLSQCDTQLIPTSLWRNTQRKRFVIWNHMTDTCWTSQDVTRCILVGVGGGGGESGWGGRAHPILYLALLLHYADSRRRLSHSKILAKEEVVLTFACITHAYDVVSSISQSVRSYDFVPCGGCTFGGIKYTGIKFTNYWRI
jgi:hypothetical protein